MAHQTQPSLNHPKRIRPLNVEALVRLWAEKARIRDCPDRFADLVAVVADKARVPRPLPYQRFVYKEARPRLNEHSAYIWNCVRSELLKLVANEGAANSCTSAKCLQTLWNELAVLERVVSDDRMKEVYRLLHYKFQHDAQWQTYFDAILASDLNYEEMDRNLEQVRHLRNLIASSSSALCNALAELSKLALLDETHRDWLDPHINYPEQLFSRIVDRELLNRAGTLDWSGGETPEMAEENVQRLSAAMAEAVRASPRPLDIVQKVRDASLPWDPSSTLAAARAAKNRQSNPKQQYLRAVGTELSRRPRLKVAAIDPSPEMYAAIIVTANVVLNLDEEISKGSAEKTLREWWKVVAPIADDAS